MNIKVNVPILGKKAGEIVNPNDPNYKHFKSWAENKDINGGSIICELIDVKEETVESDPLIEEVNEDEIPVVEEAPVNEVTDVDDVQDPISVNAIKEETPSERIEPQNNESQLECVCDVEGCNYVGKNAQAVRMHKVGKHR